MLPTSTPPLRYIHRPGHSPRGVPRASRLTVLGGAIALIALITVTPGAHAQAVDTSTGSGPANVATYTPAAHDQLVAEQRAGRVSASDGFDRLAAWKQQPLDDVARRRVRADGITWAMAAGRSVEAAAWARKAPLSALATYALAPAFLAARGTSDRELEGQAVSLMREREPDAWRPRVFEAFWQLDNGDLARAESSLTALSASWAEPTAEQRVAVLEAWGAIAEARGDSPEALRRYDQLLALQPSHRYANRAAIFLLASTDAATAAWKRAEAAERAWPGMFSAFELASLHQQALGQASRWAVAERSQTTESGENRFAAIDLLLPRYDTTLAATHVEEDRAALGGHEDDTAAWRRLRLQLNYDRILLLSARGRFPEVIASYDELRAEGAMPPYYVLSEVAGAQQQRRRSDLAVPLYEAALDDAGDRLPMPSDTHIGLVYAYLDTGRFVDADRLLTRLEAATSPVLRQTPEAGRPNAQYGELLNLRALTQLYSDQPAQAERSATILSSMAPMNAGFRSAQAETAMVRNHPDAAADHYREVLVDHPDDVAARAGFAGALFDVGELKAARELTDRLETEAPDAIAVRNAVRLRNATMAPRLEVDAEAGKDGGALANRDWRTDTRLIAPWVDDQWRIFYHQALAHASTDGGNVLLARSGLGAEWLKGRWNLSGEVNQANDGPYRTGVALAARYRASDAWRLFATVDTNSLDTPWKARLAGIGAHATEVGASYVVDESRVFEGTAGRMDFSDGNARDSVGLTWRERLASSPEFQLESTMSIETARYQDQSVPYFSPSRETAEEIGLRGRYLTWKRDDRSFAQAVEVSTGRYQQEGFGSGLLWSLRYAHEWGLGPTMRLRYGLGVSSRPYDGVRERRPFVFLSLSVPLQ